MDPLLVALIGYVIGAVFRTVYDALWKILETPGFTWDQKYTITMLISIILSMIGSLVTFTVVTLPVDGDLWVFLYTFGQGFAINHVVNKAVSYLATKPAA